MSLDPELTPTPDASTATEGAQSADATPAVEAVQPGPWAADLDTYFGEDAAAKAAADRYLREKVQPRITQLEEGTKPARELWDDLNSNTTETMHSLVSEVYGDEIAAQFVSLFDEESAAPEDAPEPTDDSRLSAEERELLEWARDKRDEDLKTTQQSEYEQAKAEFQKEHPDLTDLDMKLIDPFFAAFDTEDEAYAAYKEYRGQFAPAGDPEPTPEAPAVLGSEASAPAVPPTQKEYRGMTGLDEAMDDFLADTRASRTPPPVVG